MKVRLTTTPTHGIESLKTGSGATICKLLSIKLTKCHGALNTIEVSAIGSGDFSYFVLLFRFRLVSTFGEIYPTLSILHSGVNGSRS